MGDAGGRDESLGRHCDSAREETELDDDLWSVEGQGVGR